jgi:hypothetical protein
MIIFSNVSNVSSENHTSHDFWAQYRVFSAKLGDKRIDHCGLKELLMLCNFSYWYDALSVLKFIQNCDIKAYTVETYYSFISFV